MIQAIGSEAGLGPRRRRIIVLAFWAICLAVPSGADAGQAPEFVTPPAAAGQSEEPASIAYEVSLMGVENDKLLALLRASSQLVALTGKPPATAVGLRRRAEGDVGRLTTALRSEGYYDSKISFDIDSETQPAKVTVHITPGPRYHLASYDVSYVGAPAPAAAVRPTLKEIGVEPGMAARAPDVVAAEQKLVGLLRERGYAFAKVAERKTFVNQDTKKMTVRLAVDAGRKATFGPLTFKGAEGVDDSYLRRVVEWPEGAVYDSRVVRDTEKRLSDTGLFDSVNAEPAAKPDASGALPVTVTLVARERRSIGAAASISSDIGPGGEVYWEHRNLLGENEKLRVSATASKIEQTGELSFRKPAFLAREQALLADVSGGFQDNDAFQRQSVDSLVSLERPLLEHWRVSAGVSGSYSIVDDKAGAEQGERQFTLFGLPLTANRDTTDDPLNPASGTRLQLSLTPSTGVGTKSLLFLTAVAAGSAYYAIDKDERFILAGRTRVGSILGEATASLPADRRFYAGGGGSIRGYQFQSVGPLDRDQNPLGGSSLFEVSTELRVRVTNEIGVVPFLDGGTVYDDAYFNGGEPLRWGAGLGLRYFTGFGPVRLDVAIPLTKRKGVDEGYQFYISFGQAF